MNKQVEEIWLQKEVIEFLRAAPSSFFSAERYEWLRSKAIHDGSRCKYKKSDVMKFIDLLQKGEVSNDSRDSEKESA